MLRITKDDFDYSTCNDKLQKIIKHLYADASPPVLKDTTSEHLFDYNNLQVKRKALFYIFFTFQ